MHQKYKSHRNFWDRSSQYKIMGYLPSEENVLLAKTQETGACKTSVTVADLGKVTCHDGIITSNFFQDPVE